MKVIQLPLLKVGVDISLLKLHVITWRKVSVLMHVVYMFTFLQLHDFDLLREHVHKLLHFDAFHH